MYKERIANLMKTVKDTEYGEDDLDFIESRMKTFTDYVGHVAWMETRMQRLRIEGIKGQEYRDEVQHLDSLRRSKHDVAIDAINQLNRMSKMNGLEPFYEGDMDNMHRSDIGDAIGDIVNEYFQGRDGRTLKREDLMDDFTEAVENLPQDEPEIEK